MRLARTAVRDAPVPAPPSMEKEVQIVTANGTSPEDLDSLGQAFHCLPRMRRLALGA